MSMVDLIMPKLGESIVEATILKWHKKPGDKVAIDENLLDIATDKVDSEVPSSVEGTLSEILFQENDVVPIGTVIARINTVGEDNITTEKIAPTPTRNAAREAEEIPYQPVETKSNNSGGNGIRFYSPLVLNIASSEGISMSELENMEGTGQDGRVSKKDILYYLQNRGSAPQRNNSLNTEESFVHEVPSTNSNQEMATSTSFSGNVEIIEMDRMRTMIAKHMIDSQNTSAHVTSFTECDVTNMVLWRNRIKNDFEKREGEKITFTPLFVEAIVKAIKKYPLINSSVEGTRIIMKKDINIGMAAAMPNGNLIVPVIKNADELNLTGLTKQVNTLANNARISKLKPDDTAGGTFTLTNVGTFGSLMGTPIINQPQVAIMAVGAIKKRPVVIETAQGDSIAIRHMMYISLSYDHRIIDGALGSTFLNAVSKELENFDSNRSW
ncbi:MAG: dihydrolipoamide acetyltransferase family protein [Ginsengibacter sp.]|jgi:2-oxoglutarate dehydrogenase E2 component (dihydrolipoamide succinyltransferase)